MNEQSKSNPSSSLNKTILKKKNTGNDDIIVNHSHLPTQSWEPEMAKTILQQMSSSLTSSNLSSSPSKSTSPFMVAIVGIPGSGKSTSTQILKSILESTSSHQVAIIPMDGYHLLLSKLQEMDRDLQQQQNSNNNNDLLSSSYVYRRGAPDTFDPTSLLNDLKLIRGVDDVTVNNNNNVNDIVYVPGFNHAIGDPERNQHTFIRDTHSIVLCEGLYLLHEDQDNNWNRKLFKEQFDLSIYINANLDDCINKLKIRNKCIPGYTEEEIDIRCDIVDRENALSVIKCKDSAEYVVDSVVSRLDD